MVENGVVAFVNTPPPGSVDAPESAGVAATIPSPTSEREPPSPRDWSPWFDRRLVVAGVGVAVVRFVFAADRRVFHLFADEPGQLAMARWLSGGTRWTMLDHNTWRPGYALVLAPFAWVFDGGEALVRAALTVNAVLAGLTAVLLARLVRRWTGLPLGASAAIAAATALAPAAIAASAYTWSESLITLVLVATLWFLQRFIDGERLIHAVAAVAMSGFALTTHGRAATVLPTTLLICAFVLVRRGRGRQVALLVLLAAGITIGSQLLTAHVQDAVWDEMNGTNSTGAVIERLDAPSRSSTRRRVSSGTNWWRRPGWSVSASDRWSRTRCGRDARSTGCRRSCCSPRRCRRSPCRSLSCPTATVPTSWCTAATSTRWSGRSPRWASPCSCVGCARADRPRVASRFPSWQRRWSRRDSWSRSATAMHSATASGCE